jgi:hypothetical protein
MGRPRFTQEQIAEWVRLFVHEGLTMTEIGDRYGVTREYVRQCLKARGVSSKAVFAKRRRLKRIEAGKVPLDVVLAAMASAVPCAVCGGWVVREGPRNPSQPTRTCSPECAGIWPIIRYRHNPEVHDRQRVANARRFLAHPERYTPSKLRWAERMMSDNPPPPNRRFAVPNSLATKALAALESASCPE